MNTTKKFLACMLCCGMYWNAVAAVEDVLCLDMKISYSADNVGKMQHSAISWGMSETRELNDMKLMLHAFDILKSFSDTYVSSSLYNRPDLLAIALEKLDLQKKLDKLEVERQLLVKLEVERQDVTELLVKLEAKRLDLQEQKKELEANQADMKQELVWLEADISDLAQKLEWLACERGVVASMMDLTSSGDSHRVVLDRLNTRKAELKKAIASNIRNLNANPNNLGEARRREEAERELAVVEARIENIGAIAQRCADRLSNLDTEIEATQARSGRLAAKKDMMNRHLHTFGIKISHIEKELGDITLEIEAKNVRLGVSLEGAGSANPRIVTILAEKREIDSQLGVLETTRSRIEQGCPVQGKAVFTGISTDCDLQKSAILEALTANDVARRADFRRSLNQICQACHGEDVAFSCDVTWKSCFSDDMFNVLPFARSE